MIRTDKQMKEAIFAKHPELRYLVPFKMNGYPAMHRFIGVAIRRFKVGTSADPRDHVLVHDDELRDEARLFLKTYWPQRVCEDDPEATLCLVWIQ